MTVTSEELSFGPAFLLNELDIGEGLGMNQGLPEHKIQAVGRRCQNDCVNCLCKGDSGTTKEASEEPVISE